VEREKKMERNPLEVTIDLFYWQAIETDLIVNFILMRIENCVEKLLSSWIKILL
jgi:hypothetical protein